MVSSIAECGIGIVCACFPLMPALWKSILHKDRPLYSSNAKSQFEMMNSVENSRTAGRTHNKTLFNDNDSDENDLISRGNPNITTTVRAGDGIEDGSARSANRHKASLDDTGIVRTVEVRQFHESPTIPDRD